VSIRSTEVNKARFSRGLHIKYRVFRDDQYTSTKVISGSLSPEFNHSKVFTFGKLSQEHLDFFETGCITFLLFGTQEDSVQDHRLAKMTTKVM
jgi:hypothetical protein